ncbi:type II secretion system minor pseudopilin GspK [Arhodomonas aquaeolei]|uniref:type II secretion system minor pseudopilin GspK n=1 Tax=Arhodomonas aquaeolei TaxID=2369 RepID=UPI0003736FDE|nr:type II secretion system minor pseudopilin GspK [Arhodomonas aquaeolei]
MSASRYRQRGVALITAVLITALAATAATALLWQGHLAIRRTQNVVADGQAWQYALAAEAVAVDILARDRGDNDADGAGDAWYGELPPVNEGGATITVTIEDLQGRLNLNALAAGDEQRRRLAAAALERLVGAAVPTAPAAGIAPAIEDWIDDDLQPGFPGGAEDDFYTRQQPPYRAANAPLAGASGLRLIRGVDDAVLAALQGRVTALPVEAEGINLNTAPPELLAALHPDVAASDVRALVAGRRDTTLTSVEAALQLAPSLAQPELPRTWLRVDSDYFLVTARVSLGRVNATHYSVIHRTTDGPIEVIYRGETPP